MTEPSPSRPAAPSPDDVGVRGVVWFGVILLASVAVVVLVAQVTLDYLKASRPEPESHPAAVERNAVPPEPRLQTSPAEDLRLLRAQEDAILDSYGWVDQGAGLVQLPIERAMELVAEEGVPDWGTEDEP